MEYTISDARKGWTDRYEKTTMAWPGKNVIRIFKGAYPRLNLRKNEYVGKKIVDVGSGSTKPNSRENECLIS